MPAVARLISTHDTPDRRKSTAPPALPDVPMTAPIVIRSMPEMVAALRMCREERNLSHETIDHIAGWPSGYAGKLLAPQPIKNLGWQSFGLGLGVFGKMLLLVDDPEQIKRVEKRWIPRERPRNAAPAAGKGRSRTGGP
jgi:hypothetical protein